MAAVHLIRPTQDESYIPTLFTHIPLVELIHLALMQVLTLLSALLETGTTPHVCGPEVPSAASLRFQEPGTNTLHTPPQTSAPASGSGRVCLKATYTNLVLPHQRPPPREALCQSQAQTTGMHRTQHCLRPPAQIRPCQLSLPRLTRLLKHLHRRRLWAGCWMWRQRSWQVALG
jgi:hypothetical protein